MDNSQHNMEIGPVVIYSSTVRDKNNADNGVRKAFTKVA